MGVKSKHLKKARYAGLGDWWGKETGGGVGPSGDLEDSQGSDLNSV